MLSHRNENGLPVSELAQRLGARLPAMSRLPGRLRRRGLVGARKDQPDARVTTMLLSQPGRDLWARVVARRRDDLAAALAAADLADRDGGVLERLADALELPRSSRWKNS